MSQGTEPLWRPGAQRVANSQVMAFIAEANRRHGTDLENYRELHAWSVAQGADFWDLVWDFCGIIGDKGERRLINADKMPGAQFFPDARLNFAENLLRAAAGSSDALIFRGEDKVSYRLTWADLIALVSRLQQALHASGVGKGDRVTAMIPNMPETIALMLAVTSLGAIFSTCSPDFGERAVLDRFGQIEPKVFVTVDGYWYNGKPISVVEKVAAVAKQLITAETVVIVPYLGDAAKAANQVPRALSLEEFLKGHPPKPLTFARLPFNHPVEILYSSGTTGVPKCIVHSAGGMLLQHSEEHRLQCDLRAGERLFYFTTCGWMMWNWLASGIGSGATLVLFDGSPFAPQHIPEVIEAIAIGQDWDNDVRVVLFVRLAEGVKLDGALRQRICQKIRSGASPRHVPAKVVHIADIPRTKSGKITELAVRDVVHGRPVKNTGALANPEALELYSNLQDLRV